MGGSKRQTVGYRYGMYLHFGICHGPVDSFRKIFVGDRQVSLISVEQTGGALPSFNESYQTGGPVTLASPELFGGDEREGGIQGQGEVLMGQPNQQRNALLMSYHGERIPAFRGILSFLYNGLIGSNNPYVKPWAFELTRIKAGWCDGDLTDTAKEYSSEFMSRWNGDSDDPRYCPNDHEYRYGGGAFTTDFNAVKAAAEADVGYSLGDVIGWSRAAVLSMGSVDNVDPHEDHALFLRLTKTTVTITRAISRQEIIDVGGDPNFPDFDEFFALGVGPNEAVHASVLASSDYGGLIMVTDTTPSPTIGWSVIDNCVPAFGCPYSSGTSLIFLPDVLIEVRRKVRAPDDPCDPRCEDPYPPSSLDPVNYCFITQPPFYQEGVAVARGAWSPIAGTFKVLQAYSSAVGGSPPQIQYPLGPAVKSDSEFYTDQDFWEASYNGAVLAGTMVAGKTYSATGLGNVITTYPHVVSSVYQRGVPGPIQYSPWYEDKIQIGLDMNPAHIIYQCIIDTDWGMGYPSSSIDDASFTSAADALYDETFGLSFIWNQPSSIRDFINEVLNHIGGVLYSHPSTGKFSLLLIRGGYDPDTLPVFDEADIVAIDNFQRAGFGETINEITVVYCDQASNKDTSITVQDLANIQSQGTVISKVNQYPGISNGELAAIVATRDLLAASTPIAKATVRFNRSAWNKVPGDVIKLTWSPLGLSGVIMRVLSANYGDIDNGEILVELAEDVFGLPDSTYVGQQENEWIEPVVTPDVITAQALDEIPYWFLARTLSAADLSFLDAETGYIGTYAGNPAGPNTGYQIWSRTGSADYQETGRGDFVATAISTTVDSNGILDKDITEIQFSEDINFELVEVGSLALVGEGALAEWMEILTVSQFYKTATVARGVLDTVPQEHADGVRWFFTAPDDAPSYDPTERASGEDVDVKLAPMATGGTLQYTLATEMSIVAAHRQIRPYPPGDYQINGSYDPAGILEALVLTWAHRDRLQQTAYIVHQDEASIGPEAGTTYTVRFRDDSTGDIITERTGYSGATASPVIVGLYDDLRVELLSIRDGYESWQAQSIVVQYSYGLRETESGEIRVTESGDTRVIE